MGYGGSIKTTLKNLYRIRGFGDDRRCYGVKKEPEDRYHGRKGAFGRRKEGGSLHQRWIKVVVFKRSDGSLQRIIGPQTIREAVKEQF